jgi:hypothetical protein
MLEVRMNQAHLMYQAICNRPTSILLQFFSNPRDFVRELFTISRIPASI